MESPHIDGDIIKSITRETNNGYITSYEAELKDLKAQAVNIFTSLGITIIISGILLGLRDKLSIDLIWACFIAGILGSTSSALISALNRKANGWETEDGTKHPSEGKPERFSQRMATFFLYRPVFGIFAGLLVYFGIKANYFGDTAIEDETKVIFWALLSGLFIKSLIEKLKSLFDSLLGK